MIDLLRIGVPRVLHQVEMPIALLLPIGPIKNPFFIIGSGRSGTTIFGNCLARHPQITYLNEPRDIWIKCYPQMDVWSRSAHSRGGRLVLTADDERPLASRKLRKLFQYETLKRRRPVLVEKLPINNFRLGFIHAVFLDARFIHIFRDGREVARSIQNRADRPNSPWYGAGGFKWKLLADHVGATRGVDDIDALCTNNYERGLLEWSLNMEAIGQFKQHLKERHSHQQKSVEEVLFETSYNDLVDDPVGMLERVFTFMGVGPSAAVDQFVRDNVSRKSTKILHAAFTEKERQIAGELLEQYCPDK